MDPVEINAGRYYLRQLRADEHLDDRPVLRAALGDIDATAWVERRTRQWRDGTGYGWAVAEQTTGALLGEITLTPDGKLHCWTVPAYRHTGVMRHSLPAILRFAAEALGITRPWCEQSGDTAARRLARSCGFAESGGRLVLDRDSAAGQRQ